MSTRKKKKKKKNIQKMQILSNFLEYKNNN